VGKAGGTCRKCLVSGEFRFGRECLYSCCIMVRFKNRHLLVEFLQPGSLDPSFISTGVVLPDINHEPTNDDDGNDDDEGEEGLTPIPIIPFLLPLPGNDPTQPRLKIGDEGGGVIYRAIRGVVQDVFGDEGWGRIASSFKGTS
jgi:ribonuclease P/MRP protein subunit POP5